MNKLGFKTGIEIGVEFGLFAYHTLTQWTICEDYILIDPWRPLVNYVDHANRDENAQENAYQNTKSLLAPYGHFIRVGRMTSKEASALVSDLYADYIYIDARHDYKSVLEDMELWWPKLKVGGLFTGHDFLTAEEVRRSHHT